MSEPETPSDGDGIIGYTEVRIGQKVVTVPIRIIKTGPTVTGWIDEHGQWQYEVKE